MNQQSSQRRMRHTQDDGSVFVLETISKSYIVNLMVRRFGKLLTMTWECEMVRIPMQCRERNRYRLRTVANIVSWYPKSITDVFKFFQIRTIAHYTFQAPHGPWTMLGKANAPSLWARCNERCNGMHDENIADLWIWRLFESLFKHFLQR